MKKTQKKYKSKNRTKKINKKIKTQKNKKYSNAKTIKNRSPFQKFNIYSGKKNNHTRIDVNAYSGESIKNKRENFGGMFEGNEYPKITETYNGQTNNEGEKHGTGVFWKYIQKSENKMPELIEYYKGDWKDNKKEGKGQIQLYNEKGTLTETYNGYWKDDKKEGKGQIQLYNEKGTVTEYYNGDWNDNKKEGKGQIQLYNEKGTLTEMYGGDWKDDKKDGHGRLSVYEGINNNNKIRIESYEGQWINDKKNGEGNFEKYNKNEKKIEQYSGIWNDDIIVKKNMYAKYYDNGIKKETYFGDIKNDKKEGKGQIELYNENGKVIETYNGDWKDDKKEGQGQLNLYNKNDDIVTEIYNGSWKDDKFNEGFHKIPNKIYENYANGEKISSNPNKSSVIKSAPTTIQLSKTCMAHSVSRSITRTFLVLTLIDGKKSEEMFIAIYCAYLKYLEKNKKGYEIGSCEGSTILDFNLFFKYLKENNNLEVLFSYTYNHIPCPFYINGCLIEGQNYKILTFTDKEKQDFIIKFNELKNYMMYKQINYTYSNYRDNYPPNDIKNALKKRLQPLINVQCHGKKNEGHALILRSWGKEYDNNGKEILNIKQNRLCYKNTWEHSQNDCIDDISEICTKLFVNDSDNSDNSLKEIKPITNINFVYIDFDLDKIKSEKNALYKEIISYRIDMLYSTVYDNDNSYFTFPKITFPKITFTKNTFPKNTFPKNAKVFPLSNFTFSKIPLSK